jgi:hypothetical protein
LSLFTQKTSRITIEEKYPEERTRKNNKTKTQKGGRTLAYEVAPWRRTGALRPVWRELDDLLNRFFGEMRLAVDAFC